MCLELIKFLNLNYSGSIVLETFIIFLRKLQRPQAILTQHSNGGVRFISNSVFLRFFFSSTLSLKRFKLEQCTNEFFLATLLGLQDLSSPTRV